MTPNPMIKRRMVGVKLPDSGVANTVGVAVRVAVGITLPVGVGVLVGVVVVVGVADGVAVKAGPSDAETVKVLVNDRKIPATSLHEIVILCSPGARPVGGVHFQSPLEGTFTLAVIGSDSTVIEMVVPTGPSPKNSGLAVVTVSPSLMLSRVTVLGASAPVRGSSTLKPDDGVASLGRSSDALGISLSLLGGELLKSCVFPKEIGGTGLADWG